MAALLALKQAELEDASSATFETILKNKIATEFSAHTGRPKSPLGVMLDEFLEEKPAATVQEARKHLRPYLEDGHYDFSNLPGFKL